MQESGGTNLFPSQNLSSPESERAVLASILLNSELFVPIDRALPWKEKTFTSLDHQALYICFVHAWRVRKAIDTVIVCEMATRFNIEFSRSPLQIISEVTTQVPSTANYTHYVQQLIEIKSANDMVALAKGFAEQPRADLSKLAHEAQRIADLAVGSQMAATKFEEDLDAYLEHMRKLRDGSLKDRDVFTGIPCIDKLLGGYGNGHLCILAARPSTGKTALACNITANILKENPKDSVLVFSFEMTRREILNRVVSAYGRVPVGDISGHYGPEIYEKAEKAARAIAASNLYIAESMQPTLEDLLVSATEHKKVYGAPKLMVVDYLQLMGTVSKSGNRNDEIGQVSRGLKALATELDIPILVLSQLRRIEGGQKPQLHHLRDSGSIEQDADSAILLSYKTHKNPNEIILEVDVAKNRHGGTGTTQVIFTQDIQHMADLVEPVPHIAEEVQPEEREEKQKMIDAVGEIPF